jgi:hypothetical protein
MSIKIYKLGTSADAMQFITQPSPPQVNFLLAIDKSSPRKGSCEEVEGSWPGGGNDDK